MSKIPLDQNGVQPGYKVAKHPAFNEGEFIEVCRWEGENNLCFYRTNLPPVVMYCTIAVFRIKQTSSPLSVRLAHHAANGREIHLINKHYA